MIDVRYYILILLFVNGQKKVILQLQKMAYISYDVGGTFIIRMKYTHSQVT